MIPALTIDEIKKSCANRYEYGESRIVGIMIARYTIENSQKMIRRQYSHWHYWAGKALDIFWLGYGAYIFPGEPGQYLVGDINEEPNVYFDAKVFVDGISDLEFLADYKYKDSIGILLCNYHDGAIHLNESAYIDFEVLTVGDDWKDRRLRDFSNSLITECKRSHDVAKVIFRLRTKRSSYGLLDIRSSAFVTDAVKGLISLFSGFIK